MTQDLGSFAFLASHSLNQSLESAYKSVWFVYSLNDMLLVVSSLQVSASDLSVARFSLHRYILCKPLSHFKKKIEKRRKSSIMVWERCKNDIVPSRKGTKK